MTIPMTPCSKCAYAGKASHTTGQTDTDICRRGAPAIIPSAISPGHNHQLGYWPTIILSLDSCGDGVPDSD